MMMSNDISSLNNSYSNSLRGISGLSGGFDRDSMIETMTMRTRARIAAYKQQVQANEWKMDAYRDITDKMISFNRKYLNASSSNSLILNKTFSDFALETSGQYKDKIYATGDLESAANLEILAASDPARDTVYKSMGVSGSNAGIITEPLDFNKAVYYGKLEGKTMEFTLGLGDNASTYSISFESGDYNVFNKLPDDFDGTETVDEDKAKKVEELLNKSLKETDVQIGNNKYTMADLAKFKIDRDTGAVSISVNEDVKALGTDEPLGSLNSLKITGGTALSLNGMKDVPEKGFSISTKTGSEYGSFTLTDNAKNMIAGYRSDGTFEKTKLGDLILGKDFNISLNGVTKTIKIPDKAEFKEEGIKYNLDSAEGLAKYLDREAKKLFGNNNISITAEGTGRAKSLKFQSDNGELKLSSTGAASHMFGKESIFGIDNNSSNRLSSNIDLRDSESSNPLMTKLNNYAKRTNASYNSFKDLLEDKSTESKLKFEINGNKIEIDKDKVTTFDSLIKELNNGDNVVERGTTDGKYNSLFKIKYNSLSDTMEFVSADKGGGAVINGNGINSKGILNDDSDSLQAQLFGTYDSSKLSMGQDAKLWLKGNDNPLYSSDNNFSINGVNISLRGAFNVTADGTAVENKNTEGVTFKSSGDTEALFNTIKDMVNDYNELVEAMGKSYTTMPDRDKRAGIKYKPLTDEQKEKMTEKQIEKWEAKAKEGLLFGDTNLRDARNGITTMFAMNGKTIADLEKIGISMSSFMSNKNGTLELDEGKLKDALKNNMSQVKQIFVGDGVNKGLAEHMKDTISRYASDTGVFKGSLVRVAGSKYAPSSLLKNEIQSRIGELNKTISFYEAKLKNETDRYIKQFSHLEKLMMLANSQSGYLADLQGY